MHPMAAKKRQSKKSGAAARKTYYPAKTFDDDLVGLGKLFKTHKWSFSGVKSGADLEKSGGTQRKERKQHDAVESHYLALHESFGLAQETRYHEFAKALN